MIKFRNFEIAFLLFLIPAASATFTINNNSFITDSPVITINISNGETYTLFIDNCTYPFESDGNYTITLNDTLGYHNLSISNSTSITFLSLIYDISPPIVEIHNLSSTTYYYTHLPVPTITMSDPDNWGFVFIISETPISSTTGTHTFSVTVSDLAGRQNTASMNYTIAGNTIVTVIKERTLLLPLMNTSFNFTSSSPVNLSILLPIGFVTAIQTYTNITSLNCTVKAGTDTLDKLVNVSLLYTDQYNESGIQDLQYWIVGNKTMFYMSYDIDYNTYISRVEAINATKNYYTTATISSDRIKEMITIFRNNSSYLW